MGIRKHFGWSPDRDYLAFLRLNEASVPTYTDLYYQTGHDIAPAYPLNHDIRYRNVGETTPTTTFHLLKVGEAEAAKVEFESFDQKIS